MPIETKPRTGGDSIEEEFDELGSPECYYSRIPTYKVILLGQAGAGKSSLFWRYKYGTFSECTSLQGTDRFKKEFVNDCGQKVQVCIRFVIFEFIILCLL